ncbi:MAG: ankyrin repeat domain-containing protein [Candidatus Symbiothrix sp.]|jgi:PKD repeat protein|nr:ankyrin repeat domain-containing protein [Candidatus Symbiothrix sp.]
MNWFLKVFRKNADSSEKEPVKKEPPSPKKLINAAKGNVWSDPLVLVTSLLEKGADVNAKDKNNTTALMFASAKGNTEMVKLLLEKGADLAAKDEDEKTALAYASGEGHTEIVKTLLEKGADVNAKGKYEKTALVYASDNGYIEVVKTLLENGGLVDEKYKEEVNLLLNGPTLPSPVEIPPLPEWAQQHDISIVVEVEKTKMELQITAKSCTVNWGDGSADKYTNMKEKNISHRYPTAGNYTITIDAEGLTSFQCYHIDANVTDIYLNNCPELEQLICYLNRLTSLDLSRCKALKNLFCSRNKLASLDLSNNMALEYLSCESNLLTCLDISNHTALYEVKCVGNQLSILHVGNNSALARLMCNNNRLSKQELNRIFNCLPNYNSSYGTVSSWYAGQTSTPEIFIACGNNSGFDSCNKAIAKKKKWLVWMSATYILATMAGTPGHWQEDWR